MNNASNLIETLEQSPKSKTIEKLIKLSEDESDVDVSNQFEKLVGVWELRWSSSKSPVLNYSPFFNNFQILDLKNSRALNFLSPKGLLGKLLSTNILAKLDVIDQKRINVTFEKAGIIGPHLFGKSMVFLSEIKKTQTGWLDTTVLTDKLRVCRGYKGTTFALLKREDLLVADFFNPINN